MSGVWGPERRLRASRGVVGASRGKRVDALGNEIKAADGIVQDERSFWRQRVRALEGALELVSQELWESGGRPVGDDV